MKYKYHVPKFRFWGYCLLIWCCNLPMFSTAVSAQCNVFFSHCPGDITISDCDGAGFVPLTWPTPIAATTGGCVNFNIAQTSGPAPGTIVPAPGVYTVTYAASATDMGTGKVSKAGCTITIHVEADNTPPVFTFCPPNITLYTGNESSVPGTWSIPVVEDNCGSNIKVTTKIPCNTKLRPGVHTIVYKAVDASGNVTYCSFTVTVLPGFPRMEGRNDTEGQGHLITNSGLSPTDFRCSPNPFQDHLALFSNQKQNMELSVRIFDAQGRLVALQPWRTGANTLRINTESFNPGVFYITITSPEGAIVSALRGIKM